MKSRENLHRKIPESKANPNNLFPQPKLPKIMGPRSVFQPFKKKALRESYLEKFRGQVMWSSL